MQDTDDLSKEAAKCILAGENMTIDQFLDRHNVPKKYRTDFAVAAMMKQAIKICDEESGSVQ